MIPFPDTPSEGLVTLPLTKDKLIGEAATLNVFQKIRATEIVEILIEIIKVKRASIFVLKNWEKGD